MTTSPSATPSSPSPTPDPDPGVAGDRAASEPLRLALRPPARGVPLEGAWHPRSRDLRVEGADLVDRFPDSAGRAGRLLISRPDWDPEPGGASLRRIRAARGPVKVGSFPRDDTHLTVVKTSHHALRLLVVPPSYDEDRGRRILEQAASPANTLGTTELLDLP